MVQHSDRGEFTLLISRLRDAEKELFCSSKIFLKCCFAAEITTLRNSIDGNDSWSNALWSRLPTLPIVFCWDFQQA